MSAATPRAYALACLEAKCALPRQTTARPGRDGRLFKPTACRECGEDGGPAGIGGQKGLCAPCERRAARSSG